MHIVAFAIAYSEWNLPHELNMLRKLKSSVNKYMFPQQKIWPKHERYVTRMCFVQNSC